MTSLWSIFWVQSSSVAPHCCWRSPSLGWSCRRRWWTAGACTCQSWPCPGWSQAGTWTGSGTETCYHCGWTCLGHVTWTRVLTGAMSLVEWSVNSRDWDIKTEAALSSSIRSTHYMRHSSLALNIMPRASTMRWSLMRDIIYYLHIILLNRLGRENNLFWELSECLSLYYARHCLIEATQILCIVII